MHCPKCNAESRVLETRGVNGNNRRRRACSDITCDHRFTTIETVVESATRHSEVTVLILPKHTVREMRESLALLDRGLNGELSQNLGSDRGGAEPEEPEGTEG